MWMPTLCCSPKPRAHNRKRPRLQLLRLVPLPERHCQAPLLPVVRQPKGSRSGGNEAGPKVPRTSRKGWRRAPHNYLEERHRQALRFPRPFRDPRKAIKYPRYPKVPRVPRVLKHKKDLPHPNPLHPLTRQRQDLPRGRLGDRKARALHRNSPKDNPAGFHRNCSSKAIQVVCSQPTHLLCKCRRRLLRRRRRCRALRDRF
jgi:hypothetical protein